MKLNPGDIAPTLNATTIDGRAVHSPNPQARYVHLQFRRFAGCPVCNFHLLTMSKRHTEIKAAGVH